MESNGHIIDSTNIAVDYWNYQDSKAHLFFLTHVHADHMVGLNFKWKRKFYTSEINFKLLQKMTKISPEVIEVLEVGTTYTIPMDSCDRVYVEVTFIDANHIPGAVMILFQGYFGNILYTGDTRYHPGLINNPALHDVASQNLLDVLYLDNTYCDPCWDFPSKDEAIKHVFDIIDSHITHNVHLGVSRIGKIDVMIALAKRYSTKIYVTKEKFALMSILNCAEYFTNKRSEAFIFSASRVSINKTNLTNINIRRPTIGILLTSLYYGWKNGPYSKQEKNNIFVVPYSEHSSWKELNYLVKDLKPKSIKPIVSKWTKTGFWKSSNAPDLNIRCDMSVFTPYMDACSPIRFVIPPTVLETFKFSTPCVNTTDAAKPIKKWRHPKRSFKPKERGVHYFNDANNDVSMEAMCDDNQLESNKMIKQEIISEDCNMDESDKYFTPALDVLSQDQNIVNDTTVSTVVYDEDLSRADSEGEKIAMCNAECTAAITEDVDSVPTTPTDINTPGKNVKELMSEVMVTLDNTAIRFEEYFNNVSEFNSIEKDLDQLLNVSYKLLDKL